MRAGAAAIQKGVLMKNPVLGLFLALAIAAVSAVASDREYYVAVNGDDAGSGTQAQPLRTLAGAREKVRAIVAAGLTGNVTVNVRGGVYPLAVAIVFDERDGGSGSWTVTYKAYPGEKAVLTGGRSISGWTKVSGSVYSAVVPEVKNGEDWFRNLWCNKTRCTFKNPETVKVWAYNMARTGPTYDATAALVTAPGDWATDKTSGTVFYNAGGDDPTKQIFIAGRLDKLVVMDGADPDTKIRNFRLVGFYLMHTDWELPAQGYREGWAGLYKVGDTTYNEMPTAVEAAFADNVVLENLHVLHTGGGGIAFARGVSHSKIVGCLVTDAAGGGLTEGSGIDCPTRDINGWSRQRVCSPGDPDLDCIWGKPGYYPRDNEITDNYIHHIGLVFYSNMGIKTAAVYNPHVAYNYVHHVQYMGIDMPNLQGDSVRSIYAKYNHVAFNDLYNTGGGSASCATRPHQFTIATTTAWKFRTIISKKAITNSRSVLTIIRTGPAVSLPETSSTASQKATSPASTPQTIWPPLKTRRGRLSCPRVRASRIEAT